MCLKVELLKGKTLYLELLFMKILFFIQNKHLKIRSEINAPLETNGPLRIAIHRQDVHMEL
jgi:hypothetical protein